MAAHNMQRCRQCLTISQIESGKMALLAINITTEHMRCNKMTTSAAMIAIQGT